AARSTAAATRPPSVRSTCSPAAASCSCGVATSTPPSPPSPRRATSMPNRASTGSASGGCTSCAARSKPPRPPTAAPPCSRGARDETTSTTDPPLPPELAILDQVASDPTAEERRVGIVDRFFPEKGFGFLHYDEGRSIFFHVTQCEEGGEGIAPGTRLSFRI